MPFSFPSNPSIGSTSQQNGRSYTYRGSNVWELTPVSGEDTLLRSLFVPPAPTSVTASAGNAQATVSWTAPSGVISQAPITDYTVQYSSNSGSTWTTFTRTASTATSAVISSLTNGTAYQFRVAAVNSVGTGSYSAASTAVTPVAGDALWANVQLLLPGDTSTNDVSAYSRSVTASGGVAVSTSEKRWGAGSLYFNGTTGKLSASPSPALSLGTGDFCAEMWVYPSGASAYQTLFSTRSSNAGEDSSNVFFGFNTGTLTPIVFTNSLVLAGSASVSAGTWSHIAFVRASGVISIYLNGTRIGNTSFSTSITGTNASIGLTEVNQHQFAGYIDDFRLTVGSNRSYTGETIQVPTAAFPNAGPYADPFMDKVSLLLHADGTGSSFVDSSLTSKTITAVGASQSTTQSKFGGKSAFFNGSSDCLSSPISSAYEFGTGDFCVEAWLYPTSFNDFYRIVGIGVGAAGGGPFSGWNVRLTQTAGKLSFFRYDGGVTEFSSTASLSLNQWNYVAVARASGVLRLYVNGDESGTFSATGAFDRVDNGDLEIGRTVIYNANTTIYYAGYIDELRITKGSARSYTGATIPVPTAAFPDA